MDIILLSISIALLALALAILGVIMRRIERKVNFTEFRVREIEMCILRRMEEENDEKLKSK